MIEYTSKVTHKELKGINGFVMLFAIVILEILFVLLFFVGNHQLQLSRCSIWRFVWVAYPALLVCRV